MRTRIGRQIGSISLYSWLERALASADQATLARVPELILTRLKMNLTAAEGTILPPKRGDLPGKSYDKDALLAWMAAILKQVAQHQQSFDDPVQRRWILIRRDLNQIRDIITEDSHERVA